MNDAFTELRAARRAWRASKSAGADVERLWALRTYVNARFRVSCRGAEGDTPASATWQRRLHYVERSLNTAPTAAQLLSWNQSPTFVLNERLPAPPGVEAVGQVRRFLDEKHPIGHTKETPTGPGPMMSRRKTP